MKDFFSDLSRDTNLFTQNKKLNLINPLKKL